MREPLDATTDVSSDVSCEVSWARACPADLPAICALLASHGLPTADLAEHVHCVVAKSRGELSAVAGIEVHGTDALLRSVCVREDQRGQGLAMRACEWLEAHARALGVSCFYLLTTTAQAYFERRGFTVCSRAVAPEAIRATAEFRALCPATAICMRRQLARGAVAEQP